MINSAKRYYAFIMCVVHLETSMKYLSKSCPCFYWVALFFSLLSSKILHVFWETHFQIYTFCQCPLVSGLPFHSCHGAFKLKALVIT